MSKQEWKIKYAKWYQQEKFDNRFPTNDEIFDFFYSLHLQEIEKIGEMKKEIPAIVGTQYEYELGYNQALDDVLLTIAE